MEEALFWLLLNILTILILAFFSMEEMAIVSFNKVRLQFLVSEGNERAIWVHELLKNPSRLFGTTLIGVNTATFVGSECARNFHESIGLSPDLAPISQVILVVVFGELAPMFAARRYFTHVALLGIPLLYLSSIILAPFIWIFGLVAKWANLICGGKEEHPNLFLTQDELQKVIEEQDEERIYSDVNDFNQTTTSIFLLRKLKALNVMNPLNTLTTVSSQTTVGNLRHFIKDSISFVVVYHKVIEKIIGVVYIKDLLRENELKKLHDFCKSPWFILESTPLIDTLKQFRQNSETVAIVLNPSGKAVGTLTFEDILDEIFPRTLSVKVTHHAVVDKTINGKMTLSEFSKEFHLPPFEKEEMTISDYLTSSLEHHPEVGDQFVIPPYTLIVKESTLFEIKTIQVKDR